nr:hypothetical protein Iba_chr03dCG11810 [Ipomoea batatas]
MLSYKEEALLNQRNPIQEHLWPRPLSQLPQARDMHTSIPGKNCQNSGEEPLDLRRRFVSLASHNYSLYTLQTVQPAQEASGFSEPEFWQKGL